jgi:hypothetical protein
VLAVLRDIRYPWQQSEFFALRYEASYPWRARLYADVTQTDPGSRYSVNLTQTAASNLQPFLPAGVVPEEAFLQLYSDSAQYFRVGGALIMEQG